MFDFYLPNLEISVTPTVEFRLTIDMTVQTKLNRNLKIQFDKAPSSILKYNTSKKHDSLFKTLATNCQKLVIF